MDKIFKQNLLDYKMSGNLKSKPSSIAEVRSHSAIAAQDNQLEKIKQADFWVTRRSKIRAFQSFWYDKIANEWESLYLQLEQDLKPDLQQIGVLELVRSDHFYKTKILPKIKTRSTHLLDNLTREIQLSLNELENHLRFDQIETSSKNNTINKGKLDGSALAYAAVPLAGAVGVAGWTITGSVLTTSAMFGLIGTSSVSLPILAGGIAGATVLGSIGVINTDKLKKSIHNKLQKSILDEVHRMLVHSDDSTALSQKMQNSVYIISQQLLSREFTNSTQDISLSST